MISLGVYLPIRSRFVCFFVGIAFLGALSAPLQAADTQNPSTWDKIFGNEPKAPESDSKQPKPKKAKTSKEAPKKQKNAGSKKPNNETKVETPAAQSAQAVPDNKESSQTGASETGNTKLETGQKTSSGANSAPFWSGLFSAASSSSPFQQDASQTNLAPVASVVPAAPIAPAPSPVTAPSALPPASATISEPASSEPFWKRIFGGAPSKQPESKPEAVAPIEPVKELAPAPSTPPAPIATSNKTGGEEEPSFWQRLFGSKSSDKKVGAAKSKPSESVNEQSTTASSNSSAAPTAATATTPNAAAIALPAAVEPLPSANDTKTNFSLATVCEREKCELMVVYDAPINKTNVDKFIQGTASIPAGTAVLLNSTDGDLNSGIRLGQAFRQKHFNTRVGRTKLNKKTLNEIDGQCFSACVLAFAGGVNRRIDPNDQIGIYALRSNSKSANENELKAAVNNLGIYFDQMGVDRRFVEQMLQVKGSAVSLVSLSNAKLLNLDNGSRLITYPWRMQALDDGMLIILVTEKQATNHFSITLGLTKQNKDKDFRLTVFAKPLSSNLNLSQLADYLNRDTRLQLAFNNQTIAPSLIKPWEATSSGVQTAIPVSDKELTSISSALEFELDLLQTQNNPYKLDGVTMFGTSGLKGALAAIKK
jgi:hypothetical protein